MDGRYLKNIKIGMKVIVLTSQNRESTGFVQELAARNDFNEEGIMVRLKNGDIGRVKKIILNEQELNDESAVILKKLIDAGENFSTEFKSSALWSVTFNPNQIKESKSFEIKEYGQRASKVIIARSIAAFLNSEGGNLVIGVKENKIEDKLEIIGIHEDVKKAREHNLDGYKRTLIDEVIRAFFPTKIFNHLDSYIHFEFVKLNDKTLCWIKIKKSDSKVFLKLNDKDVFMIRVNSENRTLEGEKLVDYCIKKWPANR